MSQKPEEKKKEEPQKQGGGGDLMDLLDFGAGAGAESQPSKD